MVFILCILLMIPLMIGCGHSLKFWKKKKEVEVIHKKLPPFNVLFKRTVEMYNAKQYKDAINSFLFLRENYPQETKYQSRITLYLADSHFHQKEYPEAIANYEEFIKLYPASPDVPYAYFQIGMSNYNQRRRYQCDATFVRKAIKDFKKVLQIAPPGVLINESIRMIALCQRELALHDLFIADFYLRTHHYKSAIFRYQEVLRTFPNFKIYDRAHLGIGKAYLKLKIKKMAFQHLSYVARNYPDTPYGKEAWKLLQKRFKVATINDLSLVTFPVKKALLPGGKIVAQTAAKKVIPKAPVVQEKKGREGKEISVSGLKPHVYSPKIAVVEERPSFYYPPVRRVITHPPAKEAVKTAERPVAKRVKISRKLAASSNSSLKKNQVVQSPSTGRKIAPQGGAIGKVSLGRTKNEKPREVSVSTFPPKPYVKKRSRIKKAENTPANVKRLAKPDTLPPEKTSSGLLGALDTRRPIKITSDHVVSIQGKHSVRFYGKVIAKQKDVTLRCDELTALYTPGGNAIDRIVAHGDVTITQLNKKVKCAKAVFYNAERKIELEGAPTAWDEGNKISGDKMILLLDKNEIKVLGTKKKPTELVIYPKKSPGLLKAPGKAK